MPPSPAPWGPLAFFRCLLVAWGGQTAPTCERMHIKKLMAFKYDWNVEVVAQFYATLYIEEAGSVRQMHWMTQGRQYSILFSRFARLFGFGQVDLSRERIHIGHPLPREEIEFMYPPQERQHAGSVSHLYTYYSVPVSYTHLTLPTKP